MFQLHKWYFDCVTDAGDVAILYRAGVRYGALRLHYGASLYKPAFGEPFHRATLRPGNQAVTLGGVVEWRCPRLDLSGTWSGRSPGYERTLLDSREGLIHWHCVCPSGDAKVHIGDYQLHGSGYVEHLTLTVKPWRLPFDELRWGRWVGHVDSLLWIEWRGPGSQTWVWFNDVEQPDCRVSDDKVLLPDKGIVLELHQAAVLRAGALTDTALRPIRAVTGLLPQWRSAHETKWLARGTISGPDQSDTGWAIHEVVQWP
ncbi:MAG: hypothetical protein OEN20_09040 [Gammaproteobacteria bacterium]|nr:hypothetical protein [Gammaproteobacteria bacterium]